MSNPQLPTPLNEAEAADRRKFLAACGKFAVVTPPAITLLLSTSLNSTAIAHSGGRGNNGWGNGGWDGSRTANLIKAGKPVVESTGKLF